MNRILPVLALCLALAWPAAAQIYRTTDPLAHTYSIVARDPLTGELAVAVQSHWFAVGTTVSWAEAGVGAIATQSFTNKSFGPRGLALLKSGKSAQQALEELLRTDESRDMRQVAIVDNKGRVATHTGVKCISFADHRQGNQFSVQSNMMLTDKVPAAMAQAFDVNAQLPLPERLLTALDAAQAVGGDIRGRQSAALIVVRGKPTAEPWTDRLVDLRVDDSAEPLRDLGRLLRLHRAYEHMNAGDLAIEKSDVATAIHEYEAAEKLFPQNLEMQYWHAISLANNKRLPEALKLLKPIFKQESNWRILTERLPKVGLLTLTDDELKQVLSLK